MSALIAFLFVFIALVLWACVAVGSRHDMPEPSEPRPIRPSVDHYELDMETGDVTYHVVVTNGDRIRAMTDEELVDFMYNEKLSLWCAENKECKPRCRDCFAEWLKEEVSE